MKRLTAAVFAVCFAASAHGQVVIKGHHVGESARDILSANASLQNDLNACRAKAAKAIAGWYSGKATCDPLIDVFDRGNGQWSDATAVWNFDSGKIVAMSLLVVGDYDSLRDDIAAKANSKPVEASTNLQNALGAAWTDRDATWLSDDLHISLHQDNNPAASRQLLVTMETRAKYNAEQTGIASRTNHPLD